MRDVVIVRFFFKQKKNKVFFRPFAQLSFFFLIVEKKKVMGLEEEFVNLFLQKPLIHVLRKAIYVMVHLSSYITFKSVGSDMLRISVLDHFASGGMYVNIPVRKHNKPGLWVNLVSKDLFQLAKILTREPNIIISLHQNLFASFLDPKTNKPIVSNLVFENVGPLVNEFHDIQPSDYCMVEMVSFDLLQILISLDTVSPNVNVTLRSCRRMQFESSSAWGTICISKRLNLEKSEDCNQDSCECELLLQQVYVTKFAKQLVNALVNSSAHFCWLGIPKNASQPLIIKFLLANDIYQHYLMFPFVVQLEHILSNNHRQSTIAINV